MKVGEIGKRHQVTTGPGAWRVFREWEKSEKGIKSQHHHAEGSAGCEWEKSEKGIKTPCRKPFTLDSCKG